MDASTTRIGETRCSPMEMTQLFLIVAVKNHSATVERILMKKIFTTRYVFYKRKRTGSAAVFCDSEYRKPITLQNENEAFFKGATSRMAHLERFSLTFSNLSSVIRLHPPQF